MAIDALQPLSLGAQPLDLAKARPAGVDRPQTMQEAAKSFEALFLSQYLGHMFKGVGTGGAFGGGHAEKMWRGFLLEHIAEAAAEQGGFGIAEQLAGPQTAPTGPDGGERP
ncbi:MAG: rod-binding protein [Pseudomonadota bacterium]